MWLTRFAIRQPTVITLFFLAVALFGIIGFTQMGVNINPNVQFPVVVVYASYAGASPQEIERLVIRPIEDQLQNVRHVDKIFARAQEGSGTIIVQLKLGSSVDFAATDVQQAIDAARLNLPSDLDPPVVSKVDPNAQPILTEYLTSTKLSPVELSNLVENEIVPALKGVHGVGYVNVSGEFIREVHINPDPARLSMLGATPLDVFNSVNQGNVSFPGGRLDEAFREATVGVRADITDPAQIASLPLVVPGASQIQLKVGDVAKVVDTYQDHRLASEVNGQAAIVLNVAHDSDADTQRTTTAIRKAFKDLQVKYPDAKFSELQADEDFLHEAVGGVLQNLFEGILLTALVLLLFLHVMRSALVVMIAIPTSILATFLVMWVMGFSIDLLSLMGLSLTIGILVDDSIVVIENITRHREMGKPPEEAAIVGRTEIGGAAIAITLVDVVVFTPIAFMSGIVGEFLREYGLVIVTATMFSLLVSFTLTPLLAAHWALVRKPKMTVLSNRTIVTTLVVVGIISALSVLLNIVGVMSQPILIAVLGLTISVAVLMLVYNHFNGWFEGLRLWYRETLLPRSLRHPYLVGFGSLGLVLASFAVVGTLVPFEFQPNTEYGFAIASLTYPVGTPIDVTAAGAERMAVELRKRDDVAHVVVNVGADANDVSGGYVANLQVDLKPDKRHDEHKVIEAIRNMNTLVPGAEIDAGGGQNGGGARPDVHAARAGGETLPGCGQARRVHQEASQDHRREGHERDRRPAAGDRHRPCQGGRPRRVAAIGGVDRPRRGGRRHRDQAAHARGPRQRDRAAAAGGPQRLPQPHLCAGTGAGRRHAGAARRRRVVPLDHRAADVAPSGSPAHRARLREHGQRRADRTDRQQGPSHSQGARLLAAWRVRPSRRRHAIPRRHDQQDLHRSGHVVRPHLHAAGDPVPQLSRAADHHAEHPGGIGGRAWHPGVLQYHPYGRA